MIDQIAKQGFAVKCIDGAKGMLLLLDVWGECAFPPRPDSEIQFISPLDDITTDTDREALERSLEYGRAYLDGMDAVLGLLNNG